MALHRQPSILPIKSAVRKTSPSWQGMQNALGNQGTENSMEFFRGKALALQILKQITTLVTDC